MLALLLAAISPAMGQDDAADAMHTRIEAAPLDVATFIERRATCGDIQRDPNRDPALAMKLKTQLRCDTVTQDGKAIYEVYRAKPVIFQLLKDTENMPGW
ncbi:hypothetical protein [Sphingomonas sp. ERG5]|uniref:hypothetical protein n=1 Tax=Sphingomonas sp. ERG5 TaxID=1381597 RepID=UPI001364CCDE|nr:hypothetical protein [Sphingomonas sp. ERG5]